MTKYLAHMFVLITAVVAAGCTMANVEAPPLAGPSEMSLSLVMTANPDVLYGGSSQTLITVEARDTNGQPAANIPLRLETLANGTPIDYGTLSARTLVTGSNGRATFTYTSPTLVGDDIPTVEISATPTGSDASAHLRRIVSIRLVQSGGIIGGAPTPRFTVTPPSPGVFTDAIFDATTSAVALGRTIVDYSWRFSDGGTASGPVVVRRFILSGPQTVTLTVTDNVGLSASLTQSITIGAGNLPIAAFTISPSTGNVTNQPIFFNASTSVPGAGRRLVSYDWNFGTGATGSGILVSKQYGQAGSYTVTLTVTDDVGQKGTAALVVLIAPNPSTLPVARFTFAPSPAGVGKPVTFDGSTSSTAAAGTILRYEWNFGDGSPLETTYAPTATIKHTYTVSTPGSFRTVTLRVVDSNGAENTATHNIVVVD